MHISIQYFTPWLMSSLVSFLLRTCIRKHNQLGERQRIIFLLSSSASSLIILENFMLKDVQRHCFDKQASLYPLIKNLF